MVAAAVSYAVLLLLAGAGRGGAVRLLFSGFRLVTEGPSSAAETFAIAVGLLIGGYGANVVLAAIAILLTGMVVIWRRSGPDRG